MLETAINIPTNTPAAAVEKTKVPRRSRRSFYGYTILFATLLVGWLVRDKGLVNPEEGLGYWLGIAGGSLMALLLLYPAGKRSQLLRRLGMVKHWFRIHMIIGLLGPALILFHSNFSVNAMNSKVALYSMLLVTLSGIIGKYFYARIHRGLYGKRANIEELSAELRESLDTSRGLAAILPGFMGEMHAVAEELLGDKFTRSMGLRQSLLWTVKYYVIRARLYLSINREIQTLSQQSKTVEQNKRGLRRQANRYAAQQVGMMRQVAQLSFYERVFSMWHVFHMPLFILMVISALVHVLAVHMY
jgi:hypothetical protein